MSWELILLIVVLAVVFEELYTRTRSGEAVDYRVLLMHGGRPEENAATVAALAAELGVPDPTARYRLALAAALADAPDLALKVDAGQMEAKRALLVRRERVNRKTRADSGSSIVSHPGARFSLQPCPNGRRMGNAEV